MALFSPAHRLALPLGYQLEEYRIEAVLGQGGFGVTYLALDTKLDARVAIKEMLPKDFATRIDGEKVAAQDPSREPGFEWAKARFIDEARLLARLNHPNIVRVYRFLERNGTAYLVMEFVQGRHFGAWLKDQRKPTEQELKGILFPLLDGLEQVHQHQLLHRDISPENIFITDGHRPILLDFGSARECLYPGQQLSRVIRPGFSPVEQYQSSAPQGPYTDIYALAGVMIQAMTRSAPPVSLDRAGKADPYAPLAKRCRGQYGKPFLSAIDAGFQVWAKDRPQTVPEWRNMLQRIAADPSPKVPQDQGKQLSIPEPKPQRKSGASPHEKKEAPIGISPALLWLMGSLVAGGLGIGAWVYFGPEPLYLDEQGTGKDKDQGKGDLKDNPEGAGTHERAPSDKPKEKETLADVKKRQDPKPFSNSLGMEFASVPGIKVWICVHQTRRQDYAAFAHGGGGTSQPVDLEWENASWNGVPVGPGVDTPVVKVNWYDAEEFCKWLSQKENRVYRLPLNAEWETAAGRSKYPWGASWPPLDQRGKPAGNFADRSALAQFGSGLITPIPGYDDGFATTSPVKSFAPNASGLYDMGANIREWCEDSATSGNGLVRGASWLDGSSDFLGSHAPEERGREIRSPAVGFRCVLVRQVDE